LTGTSGGGSEQLGRQSGFNRANPFKS
jgi:hypothetical protein